MSKQWTISIASHARIAAQRSRAFGTPTRHRRGRGGDSIRRARTPRWLAVHVRRVRTAVRKLRKLWIGAWLRLRSNGSAQTERPAMAAGGTSAQPRSEEHTSEL